MALDPSIILGVKPVQFESPLNSVGKVLQLKNAQQAGELGALKMDEYRRGVADNQALADAYRASVGQDGTINRNSLYTNLASRGLGAKLPTVQKGFADQDAATTKADADKFKLATDRHDYYKKTLGALAQDPNLNRDQVLQASRMLVQQGILPAALADQLTSTLPEDREQLRTVLVNGVKAQMTPEQMFTVFAPKPEKIDTGASILLKDTNPNSPTFGQNVGGAPIAKEQSPDNAATVNASLKNAAATRDVAQATRDAANTQRDQNTEMKLGDDYRTQSKNFKETADAYKQISSVLDKATTSPAATLAGATKFMKMIDPGSVVRESELGMALAATGVFDRAANYFNTLQRGKVLTTAQVADFKNITQQIFQAASTQQRLIDKHFADVAKGYKLRPEMVIQDFGQNHTGPVDLGSLPAAGSGKVVNFGDLK